MLTKSITLLFTLSSLAFSQNTETEKEWKVIANAADLSIENAAATFLKQAKAPADVSAKEKTELKRLKQLVAGPQGKLTPKNLLKLRNVRSIQISGLGVFKYPYFKCRFKRTDRGLFFEKTTGSQRKSGLVFQNDDHRLILLGASTVNNEPQRQYSGFTRSNNREHDAAGLIIKRGTTYLAIFPGRNNTFEIYEFK